MKQDGVVLQEFGVGFEQGLCGSRVLGGLLDLRGGEIWIEASKIFLKHECVVESIDVSSGLSLKVGFRLREVDVVRGGFKQAGGGKREGNVVNGGYGE